jgi:integrase
MTTRTVRRKDPATGRRRSVRTAVVRWLDGARVREKTFDDPVAAGRFAAEKEDEIAGRRRAQPSGRTTFSEWTEKYLRSRFTGYRGTLTAPGKLADRYLRVLVTTARRFVEHAGDWPLVDYRTSDFEGFRTALNAREEIRSPVTTEGHMARLRTIFLAAYRDRYLDRPPQITVRDLAYEKPVFDPEEIREIFRLAQEWPPDRPGQEKRFGKLKGRLYPILVTLYYSMMRRGELIHLMWSDIQRNPHGELEILIQPKEWAEGEDEAGRPLKVRWEPKDREIRAIPVHPRLEQVLADLEDERGPGPWVFTNYRGQRWTGPALQSLAVRFERSTGIKVGFHIWRRTGLTHLHDAGVPPGQIRDIAGHSSLSTTMRYVRPSAQGRRRAIRALEAI